MKEVVSLIYELKNKGLKVELDTDALNLKVKGNTQLLTEAHKKALVSLKPDIIRFLSDRQAKRAGLAAIPQAPVATDYAVSSAQQRIWLMSQFEASNIAYSMPAALAVEGLLDKQLLETAFFQMMLRYEVLRTVFIVNESAEVRQWVQLAEELDFSLYFRDLQFAADPDSALKEALRAAETTPFDLAKGPLVRVYLFQTAAQKQVLLINIHHIICDGISMEMLLEEALARYEALAGGENLVLPEMTVQYKDYACWQREQLKDADLSGHRAYWLEQLSGRLPVLSFPSDRERPAVMSFNGSSVFAALSEETTLQLKKLVQTQGATVFMGLLAGLNALFYRYTGDEEIIIGTPLSGREHVDLENQLGLFLNMLALRTKFSGAQNFTDLLQQVKQVTLSAYQHQSYPFDQLVGELNLERDASRSALFDVMLVMHNNRNQRGESAVAGIPVKPCPIDQAYSKFDFTFNFSEQQDQIRLALEYNTDIYSRAQAERLALHFEQLMTAVVNHQMIPINEIQYLSAPERQQLLQDFNDTKYQYDTSKTMVDGFVAQATCTPDATAIVFGDQMLSYRQLQEQSDRLAVRLLEGGLGKGDFIGIYVERSLEMMVGLLAILKTGAAYVPLDPSYPAERIAYIIEDAGIKTILTQSRIAGRLSAAQVSVVLIDSANQSEGNLPEIISHPEELAYLIYTSGSTGLPKGVMVTHRNVSNFFAGMDQAIGDYQPGDTWLAATTISFDISVLELFWTLTRGFKLIIAPTQNKPSTVQKTGISTRKMDFSLFYFASEVDYNNKYKLLIEGAKFADAHGFSAVWTPERHFHEFGGVYPNPAVTGAAIATITKNIHIRSGSCVLPLHNPIRVAEEWAVVDNLSQGRVGLSFASGWVMNDFLAFAPDGYHTRQETLYKGIEQVRALWEGKSISLPNPAGADGVVEIFPKPVQASLPVWVTAADNPETFRTAGKMGANLLTHLLGQTVEELAEKIKIYKAARKEAGYEGEGFVTLMIHTFIDEDLTSVKEKVRKPFTNYLRNASGLVRTLTKSMGQDINAETFTEADMEVLLDHAFSRYFDTAALFGTPASCLDMVNALSHAGVDELGCLVDFGLDTETTLNGFQQLNELKERYAHQEATPVTVSLLQLIRQHRVTHLQCTPSALKIMLLEDEWGNGLQPLSKLLVGGEPFPALLLQQLKDITTAEIYNMYGPTETTVWSSCTQLTPGDKITAGKPIANTQIYVLDRQLQLNPVGVPGEIYIGGDGVTAGYLNRPELTAERFVANPFESGGILYKTGDAGKWTPEGTIVLLGRKDDQVKIRGHRIEPGEIEAALRKNPAVNDAVVIARAGKNGDLDLAAYVVGNDEIDIVMLRNELSKTLPDYMVPSVMMQLHALPLTPNGKIDKLALPAIDGANMSTAAAYLAPRTETEQQLAALWSEVLERSLDQIGVLDNFFESGGHSLNAVRLIGLIKQQMNVKIDLQVLFYMPTIEELAHEIEMVQWANRETELQQTDRKRAKVRI